MPPEKEKPQTVESRRKSVARLMVMEEQKRDDLKLERQDLKIAIQEVEVRIRMVEEADERIAQKAHEHERPKSIKRHATHHDLSTHKRVSIETGVDSMKSARVSIETGVDSMK